MLVFTTWSSVAVWLNTTPRIVTDNVGALVSDGIVFCWIEKGYPWAYVSGMGHYLPLQRPELIQNWFETNYGALVGDLVAGTFSVIAVTCVCVYLLHRIVSVLQKQRHEA